MKPSKTDKTYCGEEQFTKIIAEPHNSIGSVADLKTGGHLFNPRLSQYSFRGLMISHCNRIHSSLTAVYCFTNGYLGKQPVAWKEYLQSTD